MKKSILIGLFMVSSIFTYSQKNIVPGFFMEVPVEQGYLFNGLNFGVGAWFGENTPFTSIGLFAGVLTYQPYGHRNTNLLRNPITQKGTLTISFDIHNKSRLLIMPSFVIGTKDFYDLNLKLGYCVDKRRATHISLFISQTYNMGVGAIIKMR